jgi:tetraacyldisaccharide 4'-kinase
MLSDQIRLAPEHVEASKGRQDRGILPKIILMFSMFQAIKRKIRQFPKFWLKRGLISYLLWPFSMLYWLIFKLRKNFSTTTIITKPCKVIVIGNLTVGGSGKTPLTIALASFLKQNNFRVGIISRGYGGKSNHYPLLVTKESNPLEVGDEALLMARNSDCPVMISPKRSQALNKLLLQNDFDFIISDDGLQNFSIPHDLEILVIDAKRFWGNGFLLPAGPLREDVSRVKKINLVVINGESVQKIDFPFYQMKLLPLKFQRVNNPSQVISIAELKNKTVHAVSGIGNPNNFFAMLKTLGLKIIEHSFPDHYLYQASDLVEFSMQDIVIMTEKDAVKCQSFTSDNFYYLSVSAKVDQDFLRQVLILLEKQ